MTAGLPQALWRRLRASASRWTARPPLRGSLDGFREGELTGWAWRPTAPDEAVTILVQIDGVTVGRDAADRHRSDLEAAGIGNGRHAFRIPLTEATIAAASRPGVRLAVLGDGSPPAAIGSIRLGESVLLSDEQRALLRPYREKLAAVPLAAHRAPPAAHAGRSAIAPLFEPAHPPGGLASPKAIPSRYADHIRHRLGAAPHFPIGGGQDRTEDFYRWYLDAYARPRLPLRVPLSRAEIEFLNTPVRLGGHPVPVPQVMLWYALDRDGPSGYRRVAWWWACQKAPQLGVEDCLVTEATAAFLRSVGPDWSGVPLPPSRFVEEMLAQEPELQSFDPLLDLPQRIALYGLVFLRALERPWLLRFVPAAVLDRFLHGPDPLLAAVVSAVDGAAAPPGADLVQSYIERLSASGFDLDTGRFASVTPDGDRIGSGGRRELLPGEAGRALVPVQIIAPFSKLSGLANAARASREALSSAGIETHCSDFVVDNPQPPLDGADVTRALVPAEVNLVHLNPDLLPLCFAYSPDVFSGRYTIGFFFWELDRIVACQNLALHLVDEIWVSSEFNRRCFAAVTDKPVITMGLAMGTTAAPDRALARRRIETLLPKIETLLPVSPGDFVVLCVYDTLSYPQRKNPLGMVEAFRQAFPDQPGVRLIVKTQNALDGADPLRQRIWNDLLAAAAADPRIICIDRILARADLDDLIAGADCYLSLHRSEGFGLGMLEAMLAGTPVVCTGYSGNVDFCTPETAWLVDYSLVPLSTGDYAYAGAEHVWAEPDLAHAAALLRNLRDDTAERERRIRNARDLALTIYAPAAVGARYARRLTEIRAGSTGMQVELERPLVRRGP